MRDRTADLLRAKQALSQLSYSPIVVISLPVIFPETRRGEAKHTEVCELCHNAVFRENLVGLSGLEPPTSPLSGVRSNHLSYRPKGITVFCSILSTIYQSICVDTYCLSFFGKEVIQPQVPLRLPCYDFTPVMNHKVVSALPKVKLPTSFATHSHGVTGGVYKARERIHRSILIYDY